jgi:hypothetical protein
MPRPPNEPRYSYGRTWMPEYSDFEPNIDYFDSKRLEIFYLRQKVEQAELYGEHKSMKYEDALQEWKNYLDANNLTLKEDKDAEIPGREKKFKFYSEQMANLSNGQAEKKGGRKSRRLNKRRRSRKYKKLFCKQNNICRTKIIELDN